MPCLSTGTEIAFSPTVLPEVEEPDILLTQDLEIQNRSPPPLAEPGTVNEFHPTETVVFDTPVAEETASTVPDLDPSILAALGEITDDSPDFGEKIHDSLSKIFTPILKKGMPKDNRDKILKEYLIPENCTLLKSPILNPEMLAAIPESGRYRDKKMALSQQQLGQGITAVSRGLNLLLTKDNKVDAIKFISDGCRVLCDLHLQNTETRKKFITPSLDKSFLQLVQATDRDETLFGNKLSENIKASKAIVQQSQQIKKNVPVAPKPSTSQSSTWTSNQGNRQGPPRFQSNRGGRGGIKRTTQRSVIPPPAPPPASRFNQNKVRGVTRQHQRH